MLKAKERTVQAATLASNKRNNKKWPFLPSLFCRCWWWWWWGPPRTRYTFLTTFTHQLSDVSAGLPSSPLPPPPNRRLSPPRRRSSQFVPAAHDENGAGGGLRGRAQENPVQAMWEEEGRWGGEESTTHGVKDDVERLAGYQASKDEGNKQAKKKALADEH